MQYRADNNTARVNKPEGEGSPQLNISPEGLEFLTRLARMTGHLNQSERTYLLRVGEQVVANNLAPHRLEYFSKILEEGQKRFKLPHLMRGICACGNHIKESLLLDPTIFALVGETLHITQLALMRPQQESHSGAPSLHTCDREVLNYLELKTRSLISEVLEAEPRSYELRSFLRRMLQVQILVAEEYNEEEIEVAEVDLEALLEAFRDLSKSTIEERKRTAVSRLFDEGVAARDPQSPEKLKFTLAALDTFELQPESAKLSPLLEAALLEVLQSKYVEAKQFEKVGKVLQALPRFEEQEKREQIGLAVLNLLTEGKVVSSSAIDEILLFDKVSQDYPQLFSKVPDVATFFREGENESSQRLVMLTALRATRHHNPDLRAQALKVLHRQLFVDPEADPELSDRVKYMQWQISKDPKMRTVYKDAIALGATDPSIDDGQSFDANLEPSTSEAQKEQLPGSLEFARREIERVMDVYFGFGGLLFETKRSPSGDPSLLSRFALQHGKLHYLNALDPNSFPGRGVVLSQLDTASLFPLRADGQDTSFSIYRSAWPRYAEEISELQHAEFFFARGMVFISVARESRYSLREGKDSEQYGLAVFNSHFGDPDSYFAALVPTRYLARILKGTLIGGEDFTGVSPTRVDAGDNFISPKFICDLPGAMSITNPDSLLFSNLPGAKETSSDSPFARLRHHDRMIRLWDRWFHSGSNISKEDADLLSEYTSFEIKPGANPTGHLAVKVEYALQQRSYSLEEELKEVGAVEFQRLAIVRRLVNVFDLFKIGLSYWHRGYTLPKMEGPKRNLEETAQVEELETELADESELIVNPDSLRMLRAAREFHQARETTNLRSPMEDPKQFPILASCSAIELGSAPNGFFFLDTFSLRGRIGGKPFQLNEEPENVEDDSFWISEVLTGLRDSPDNIKDLRFFSRASLGTEFTQGDT